MWVGLKALTWTQTPPTPHPPQCIFDLGGEHTSGIYTGHVDSPYTYLGLPDQSPRVTVAQLLHHTVNGGPNLLRVGISPVDNTHWQ